MQVGRFEVDFGMNLTMHYAQIPGQHWNSGILPLNLTNFSFGNFNAAPLACIVHDFGTQFYNLGISFRNVR